MAWLMVLENNYFLFSDFVHRVGDVLEFLGQKDFMWPTTGAFINQRNQDIL